MSLVYDGDLLFVGTQGDGISFTKNNGLSWNLLPANSFRYVNALAKKGTILVAAEGEKVLFSNDSVEIVDFKIEDYINSKTFLFAGVGDEQEDYFCQNIIEKELNKPFDTICIDDAKIISDLISSLNETEKLYLIMGLLSNYPLSEINPVSLTVEKALKDHRIIKYIDIIYSILKSADYELNNEERLSAKEMIENFEQECNITILIEK